MQIHEIKKEHKNTKARRIGRGGKRGKTSGRGMKGQSARAGNKKRPEMRDIIKKLPKRRGYGKNRSRGVNDGVIKPQVINVAKLEVTFATGKIITPRDIVDCGLVGRHSGRVPEIKLLGTGALTKAFTVKGFILSASAKEKIEKAGGSVV